MATVPRQWLDSYRVSMIAVLFAMAVSVLLWPLATRYPFIFFWPAVIVSIWAGGLKSGLLATLLSVAFTFAIFLSNDSQHRFDAIDLAATAVFIILTGGMTTYITQV